MTTVFKAALLFLAACGSQATPLAPAGSACKTDAACEAGLYCETNLPGGVCTLACDGAQCPSGSHCIEVTYSIAGVEQSAIRCLQACDAEHACRSMWRCVQALPEPYSVCLP